MVSRIHPGIVPTDGAGDTIPDRSATAATTGFTWNSTPTDAATRGSTGMLVTLCLVLSGCSQPALAARPAVTASPAAAARTGSRVLAKKDFTLRGKPACKISYVYAGHAIDRLFREESCAAVTATMMTQPELAALGKWDRLDDGARTFVTASPEGKLLYVEGRFSASVYPIGTTGSAYEVPVAD